MNGVGFTFFAPGFAPDPFARYWGTPPPPPPAPKLTDRQHFDAIVRLLRATKYFETVHFGQAPPLLRGGENPVAWVQPWKFRETSLSDDADRLRKVTYRLNLMCTGRADSPEADTFDRLDLLSRVCQSAIEGQALAGCYAAETLLADGTYADRPIPYGAAAGSGCSTLLLIGTFEYDVDGYSRSLDR